MNSNRAINDDIVDARFRENLDELLVFFFFSLCLFFPSLSLKGGLLYIGNRYYTCVWLGQIDPS